MILILLFFPAFISLNIIKSKTNINYKELLLKYPIYNVLINLSAILVIFIFQDKDSLYFENLITIGFIAKYLLLTTFLSLIMPFILEFINKNFNISVGFEKVNKNEKNK